MRTMWLRIFSGRQFEDTFENTQWRKAKQMQPMWLCILLYKHSDDTFENTQWRKVKQMQPAWLSIFSNRQFKDVQTFVATFWWKIIWLSWRSEEAHYIFTLKKNCKKLSKTENHMVKLLFWRNTCPLIMERNGLGVLNVTHQFVSMASWENTL